MIQTKRLVLKPIEDPDEGALIDMATDARVTATYMIPDLETPEVRHVFFLRLQRATRNPDRFARGIYHEGKLIGFINEVSQEGDAVEIGYFIAPSQWNQGFASEAFAAVIARYFDLGFRIVKAAHFEGNEASGKVMRKCGLVRIDEEERIEYRGKTRNCIYYAISQNNP